MAGETTMITNGKPTANGVKEPNVVASVSSLAHDVVELAELHAKLLTLDANAAWTRMRTGLVMLVIGACVLLGCVPVVLLAAAEALVEYGDWSRAVAQGVAGVAGLAAVTVLFLMARQRLTKILGSFQRSREELNENLTWLKDKLNQPRPTGRREWPKGVTLPS
jgi:hypothetical protein